MGWGEWYMSVNPSKAKHLSLNFTKEKQGTKNLQLNSYFDGAYIEKQDMVKLLGMYIQSDLKWDTHVNSIVSKASQRLRIISILKQSGYTESDLLKVYFDIFIQYSNMHARYGTQD